MDQKKRKSLIAVVVTVIFLGIMLTQINRSTLIATIGRINPIYLVVGFLLYIWIFVLRAMRMYIILEGRAPLKTLLTILFVHNMFNNLLPARTGELSYVYLLKEKAGLNINYGLSSLMIARIFDLVGISFLFLLSFFVVKDLPFFITGVLMLVTVVLGLAFMFTILLLFYNKKFLNFLERFASKTRLDRIKYTRMALEKSGETVESFKIIKSKKVIAVSLALSVAIWLIASMMTFLFLIEMEVYLSIWKIFIASGIMVITTILPIHSIGGFGTIEGTWTAIYVALGVSAQVAFASGIGVHLIIVLYFLILGIIGFVLMKMDKQPRIADGDEGKKIEGDAV